MPKYPLIEVKLSGVDGNAFAIVGLVRRALRDAGVDKDEIEEYNRQAFSGDYAHLITVTSEWVSIS